MRLLHAAAVATAVAAAQRSHDAAASPCDVTVPGYWMHVAADEVYTAAWAPTWPSFEARFPGAGHWTTMNATLSADNATVLSAVYSNGHRANGSMSSACDAIVWSDGSSWAALPEIPTIKVHVAPHTHNDVGWGETYLQYYYGTGPYPPQFRNVTKILSRVIDGLLADPARRFAYVEQAFFQLFYAGSSPAAQADIRGLVASKQLVFLNGAWSMHDEAAPTYVDMLDNTAVGHRAIAAEFGVEALPTVTWQIDPFGHSAFQGVLSSPLAGFQGVLWGREAAEFKAACLPRRALERVWLPSPSLGATGAATFAASFFDPGYDWPKWNRCLFSANASACARAQGFADAASLGADEVFTQRIRAVRGDDVLINFGTDFAWFNAVAEPGNASVGVLFDYVDGVIDGLNADPERRFRAFYSTAADYVAAKLAANLTLPALTSDLFPYNNDVEGHEMWTGYYTSRPALKGYVRESGGVLQAARQLQALAGGVAGVGPTNLLFRLERAMGVAQHHDAIAGTAVQAAADDYAARLAAGRAEAFAAVAGALAAVTGDADEPFSPCELANVTLCPPLEAGRATVVLVYNALGQAAPAAPVRLAAGFPAGVASWAVLDADGANVTAQLVPLSARDGELRALYNASNASAAAVQWLCFTGALPAAGYAAFFLLPCNTTGCAPSTHASALQAMMSPLGDASITNGRITLNVSAATGFMSGYADAASGLSLPLAQSWAAYEGFDGSSAMDGSREASGAYVFRPARQAPDAIAPGPAAVTLVTGPVLSEAQSVLGYMSQAARLWAGADHVEVEWTVGPVDVAGNTSREVVTRYTATAGLATGGAWRSDANCRESQPRRRGARGNWTANVSEPVAGNYYPVGCLLSTSSPDVTLAVAVDRSEGGASLADGQLELMVHRRMMHLDGREPRQELLLDEPGVDGRGLIVRGRHWLLAAPAAAAAAAAKPLAQAALATPTVVTTFAGLDVSPSLWLAAYAGRASLLRAPLPANVHLATVHAHNDSAWLVRLAHVYEAGEDPALSAPATLDLATLFAPPRVVAAAAEMTLPGAQPLAAVVKTTYRTEGGLSVTLPQVPPPPAGDALTITLAPMQIRTFLCTMMA